MHRTYLERARFRVEAAIPIRVKRRAHYEPTRKTQHGGGQRCGVARRNITQTHKKDSTCTTRNALLRSRNFIYTHGIRREMSPSLLLQQYRLIAR